MPEYMRAQVDEYCRQHKISVQDFLEAAALGLLAKS